MASEGQVNLTGLAGGDQNKENIKKDGQSTVFNDPTQLVSNDQEIRLECQSPRRMKDIHIDGNVDDMSNVDPYMLDDRDLDIRSDVGGVAGSVVSIASGRSSTIRSANSSRRQKIKSAGTPLPRSNAGSRARQLKDHEGSPFLSIGMAQEHNAFSPEIIQGKLSRSSYKGSRHSSMLSVSSIGLTSNSVRSSMEMTPSARNQRSKLFSSNSMIPPSKRQSEPNHNIKMPFKHSVKKPEMNVPSSNPSGAMKDRTAIATHTLNKLLHAQKPTHTAYIQGRLLKARLKPLEPVKMTTPTIHQCRGIVSETRQYSQSESRTFQRWKSIMAGNRQLPAKSFDVRDGASTSESVHQTSQASTPEPGVDFPTFDLVETAFDDPDWAEQLGGQIAETGISQGMEVPTPYSLPNSRSAPAHCDEDLSHLDGPTMTPITVGKENQGQGQFAPVVNTSSSALPEGFEQTMSRTNNEADGDDISNGGLGTSDTIGETNTITSSVMDQNQHSGVVPLAGLSKRPHSAVYHQENNATLMESKNKMNARPRTAVEGGRKAVRFADENNGRKETMENGLFRREEEKMKKQGGGGMKNGKQNGKSSCRPRSLDSGFDDRDDKGDDDGVGGGGKGRVFLTQDYNTSSGQTGQQQLQKGEGKTTGEGNNGNQNTMKNSKITKPGLNSKNLESINKNDNCRSSEKQNIENFSRPSSSCLPATVFYVNFHGNLTSDNSVKNSKSGFAPLGSKKSKTPRKDAKHNQIDSSRENTSSIKSNVNAVKPSENSLSISSISNNGEDVCKKIMPKSSKSSFSKQESNDSGISDTVVKDSDKSETESQFIKESQHSCEIGIDNSIVIPAQMIRPTSSSVKRMKAYKTIVAKSKRGNVRPYSGSVYSDVEIQDRKMTNKQRKELRPASAFSSSSSSDITQIQGKYGLYAGAKTGNSVTHKSRVSSASAADKKSQNSNSVSLSTPKQSTKESLKKHPVNKECEMSISSLSQIENSPMELRSSLSRLKSASKVTFADEDEYEDDKSSRKSIATSAKSTSHTSSILRGSVTGYTHSKGGKHDNEMADDIDYDQMWAELPDDNSDAEKSQDDYDEDYSGDEFMSKFDTLQNQFDAVAAEFEAERSKLCSRDLMKSSTSTSTELVHSSISNDTHDNEDSYITARKDLVISGDVHGLSDYKYDGDLFISEEEMAEIRESGYRLENNNTIFVTDSSVYDNDTQTIDANTNGNISEKSGNQTKSELSSPVPEFLHYKDPEWSKNGWVGAEFSCNLYKSTNRYVEVKPKEKSSNLSRNDNKDNKKISSSISSRIDHGQKRHGKSKGCNSGRKGSQSDNDNDNDENLNSEYRKPVYKMDGCVENSNSNTSTVHIVIPSMDDFGLGFSCEGTAKPKSHRALSSRATTPVAARKLLKDRKGDDNEQRSSKYSSKGKRQDGDLCIDANSCNIVENRATPTPAPKDLIRSCSNSDSIDKNCENKSNLDSNTPATNSSSSFSSKESEGITTKEAEERTNNYYELLLAYRSHCMEDSDNEGDEDEDENEKTFTNEDEKSKEITEISGKAEDTSLLPTKDNDVNEISDTESKNENIRSSKVIDGKSEDCQVSGVRPASAVTTDSGVESDGPSEEMGRADLKHTIQSDNSRVFEDNQPQSLSRPDSGVSSDAGMEKQNNNHSKPLEIVASSKNLIKQRPSSASNKADSHPLENMEKLCELPPLCFKLNARPPTGYLYYFAYGPNMNSDRIACYLGCEKSPPRFWALLFGFGMVFNMKGTSSNSEQLGGLPNLEWNPAMSMEGCVYQITQEQLGRLDKFVGYPKTVEHVVLPVWMSNSLDPDALGVAQYCVPALTFIARDEFTWKEPVPPSDYSVSQSVKSADLVTPEFKGHLASFSSNNQVALVAAS